MKSFPPSADASEHRARVLRRLLVAGLVGLAGCGEGRAPQPHWIALTRGFEPRPLLATAAGWCADGSSEGRTTARLHEGDPHQVWIEGTLLRGDWHPEGGGPGRFWAKRPRHGGFRHAPAGPMRLAAGERVFTRSTATDGPAPETFHAYADRIFLALPPGEDPPAETTFGIRIASGAAFGDSWHIRTAEDVALAIPVWSGTRETVVCDLPPHSRLQVLTMRDGPDDASRALFRILLNGEPLLEHEQEASEDWHAVDLPESGLRGARLAFEMEGAPGVGFFCDPVIGPVDPGGYGERPWESERPDVVVFLADTFRADNMATYGGEPGLTPHLDGFAARSVRFLHARAPAAWTLPSTASLFTGLYPGQHGATDEDLTLPRELTTIAEVFAAHGYRTGAITDSGFLSPAFGLDQGFGWFAEHHAGSWDLDQTLEEALAFLDRDDGRPVFLLVHTYRTHGPYREGPDEDDTAWNELVEEGLARVRARGSAETDVRLEVVLAAADRMRALYRDGVRDLDAGFGRFVAELERRRILDCGYLLFTSDHGEAFGENNDIWHGRRLWDVKLKVPLLLQGPGLAPNDVRWPASLVDVAPTLAALAGLPRERDWVGTALLGLAEERPMFAFRLEHKRELAIVEGDRKILAMPDPEALRRGDFVAAFDLSSDPGEEHELSDDEVAWASELCRRLADAVAAFLIPKEGLERLELDPETRRRLSDMGYGGG